MRVAITYANSLALGGAERVLEVLARMFPEAHFFSLMTEDRFIPGALKGRQITTWEPRHSPCCSHRRSTGTA